MIERKKKVTIPVKTQSSAGVSNIDTEPVWGLKNVWTFSGSNTTTVVSQSSNERAYATLYVTQYQSGFDSEAGIQLAHGSRLFLGGHGIGVAYGLLDGCSSAFIQVSLSEKKVYFGWDTPQEITNTTTTTVSGGIALDITILGVFVPAFIKGASPNTQLPPSPLPVPG